MEITATLKNARRCGDDRRSPNLHGNIHGDTRGRFRDGERIFTSTIMKELPGNIFQTRFSVYKVEFMEGQS